jgi:hypothetical protein
MVIDRVYGPMNLQFSGEGGMLIDVDGTGRAGSGDYANKLHMRLYFDLQQV